MTGAKFQYPAVAHSFEDHFDAYSVNISATDSNDRFIVWQSVHNQLI